MTAIDQLNDLVDWENGYVSSAIHFDEEIYKVELQRVFERSWLLVGHADMVPTPGSFVTNYMGEVPVIITRDNTNGIRVLVNRCAHRGNQVCLFDRGQTRGFVCSYHGWSYGLDGALTGVPIEQHVYPDGLDKSKHGLETVRVANFHGLIFATFDANAPSLEDWLGEDTIWYLEHFVLSLDLGGLELLPGFHRYYSPGNWKLNAENFIGDNYHVFVATHVAWLAVCRDFVERGIAVPMTTYPTGDGSTLYEISTGLKKGSVPVGMGLVIADDVGFKRDFEGAQRLGPEAVEWVEHRYNVLQNLQKDRETKMYGFMNAGIFPNISLMGFLSPMLGRHFQLWHPRGVRAHEGWQWTMVEKDAPQVVKDIAIQRVYQGQHMAGVVAPDDVENYERIVDASAPQHNWERPYYYGMQLGHESDVASDLPGRLGPNPSEADQRNFYRFWLELMEQR